MIIIVSGRVPSVLSVEGQAINVAKIHVLE